MLVPTVWPRLTLLCRLSPTYPETVPEMHISKKRGTLSTPVLALQESLLAQAEKLRGSEMIFEIVEHARVCPPW